MELPELPEVFPRPCWCNGCCNNRHHHCHWRRRWGKIIADENEHKDRLKAATIVAFAASSTLPEAIARELVSFIPTSISTIAKITDFVHRHQLMQTTILQTGRGGEGLHLPLSLTPLYKHKQWLRENQQPRLRFSQPDFRKQIRECAHQVICRQSGFGSDVETQLSAFVSYLFNNY